MEMNRNCEGAAICVPASVANLGPGLDTVAVAVRLYLRVRILKLRPERMGEVHCLFVDQCVGSENAIERALRHMMERHAVELPGLQLEVRSEIPMRSGLGSSAAATIAGLRIFELLCGPLPANELLAAASELEGHPDNAAAALLGGLTVSCQLQDGSVVAAASRWPEAVELVVLTPDFALQTAASRRALPAQINRADAVFNLQRVALFLHAVHAQDYPLLKEAMRDRWHQPFRQPLVPGLEAALSLTHPDLLGVCLSGSGPSVVALAQKNAQGIGELLSDAYHQLGIAHRVRVLQAHQCANGDASRALRDFHALEATGMRAPS
jgi:homoserine kinase